VSEELLSQARAALKLEDYDGAIRLAKQAAQELAARLLGQSVSDIASDYSTGQGGGESSP